MFDKALKGSALAVSALFMTIIPVTSASATHDDIALRVAAIEICQFSPGFEALGYGNENACIEGVYQDLLMRSDPTPGPDRINLPVPGKPCIGSRIPGVCSN
jgi:hypothetical protein